MTFSATLLQGAVVVPFAFVLIIVFIVGGFVLARVFGEAVRRNPNRSDDEDEEEEDDRGE